MIDKDLHLHGTILLSTGVIVTALGWTIAGMLFMFLAVYCYLKS